MNTLKGLFLITLISVSVFLQGCGNLQALADDDGQAVAAVEEKNAAKKQDEQKKGKDEKTTANTVVATNTVKSDTTKNKKVVVQEASTSVQSAGVSSSNKSNLATVKDQGDINFGKSGVATNNNIVVTNVLIINRNVPDSLVDLVGLGIENLKKVTRSASFNLQAVRLSKDNDGYIWLEGFVREENTFPRAVFRNIELRNLLRKQGYLIPVSIANNIPSQLFTSDQTLQSNLLTAESEGNNTFVVTRWEFRPQSELAKSLSSDDGNVILKTWKETTRWKQFRVYPGKSIRSLPMFFISSQEIYKEDSFDDEVGAVTDPTIESLSNKFPDGNLGRVEVSEKELMELLGASAPSLTFTTLVGGTKTQEKFGGQITSNSGVFFFTFSIRSGKRIEIEGENRKEGGGKLFGIFK